MSDLWSIVSSTIRVLQACSQKGALPMRRRVSLIGVLLVVSGLLPGFFAGVVAGNTLFASSLNGGLLNAFTSVGQNLFGEGAFGASAIPGNPVAPSGGVQMDISRD